VAGDLDYVFGCVGARSGEVRHHRLVDASAIVYKFAQDGRPRFPIVRERKAEDYLGDLARGGTRDPHNADARAAGRSGNRNDGIPDLQGAAACLRPTAAASGRTLSPAKRTTAIGRAGARRTDRLG
jgi:hypothetical protein